MFLQQILRTNSHPSTYTDHHSKPPSWSVRYKTGACYELSWLVQQNESTNSFSPPCTSNFRAYSNSRPAQHLVNYSCHIITSESKVLYSRHKAKQREAFTHTPERGGGPGEPLQAVEVNRSLRTGSRNGSDIEHLTVVTN